jgi:hypothetical protein
MRDNEALSENATAPKACRTILSVGMASGWPMDDALNAQMLKVLELWRELVYPNIGRG